MKNIIYIFLLGLIVFSESLYAASPNEEIEYLLHYVRESNVKFIRNGQEYSSTEAADHLKKKWVQFKDEIKTAEDFIRLAGTKSLISGKSYEVKMPDGNKIESNKWLQEELDRYRSKKK